MEENKEDTCSICLGENEDMFKLKCNHYFCISCIRKWSSRTRTCPVCRAPFCINSLYTYKEWMDSQLPHHNSGENSSDQDFLKYEMERMFGKLSK